MVKKASQLEGHHLQGMTFLSNVFTNLSRGYKGNKNIFQPPQDSHLSTILTTRTIPFYSTHLGNKTTLLIACTTQQNSLIGSIPKIKFFPWLRQCHQYLSPYAISPNKILTTHAPYTYVHVTHLTVCGRTLKHTLFEIVYEEKKEPQNKSMPIF